jgi:hypothetical protein
MGSENDGRQTERPSGSREGKPRDAEVHPAWRAFMRFCTELRHGEIEQLKVQDGLPLLAELTKKKVKFT